MGKIAKVKKTDTPFRKWRIKEGYTVKAFAREAESRGRTLDDGTIWNWDNGTRVPSPNNQKDLKKLFKTIRF